MTARPIEVASQHSRTLLEFSNLSDIGLAANLGGEVVLVSLKDPADHILTSIAAMNSGALALVVDAGRLGLMSRDDNICGHVTALCTDSNIEVGKLAGKRRIASFLTGSLKERPSFPRSHRGDGGLAFLTSGSTSHPKAVKFATEQVQFVTAMVAAALPLKEVATVVSPINPSFDYGFYQLLLAVSSNTDLEFRSAVLVRSFVEAIVARQQGVALPLTPGLLANIVRFADSSTMQFPEVALITITGGPLTQNLCDAAIRIFPSATIVPMYGLTECKRVSIAQPADWISRSQPRLLGSGHPLPATSVYATGADGSRLQPLEVGELCIEGPHVAIGYWPSNVDAGGFVRDNEKRSLRSGDRGYIDLQGRVHVLGRLAESQVKIRDERVDLAAIRAVVEAHPDVVLSHVSLIPADNADARIVIACTAPKATAREIEEWVAGQVTRLLMRSIDIELIETFDLNERAKVSRQENC